jgi:hypothetical protein
MLYARRYIAKNFPDVQLFPDLTKLCETVGGKVQTPTVFGALETPPDGDMFVAGTVCKDFSGLKTNNQDLEDKGKSGQTFFGAVEHLFRCVGRWGKWVNGRIGERACFACVFDFVCSECLHF